MSRKLMLPAICASAALAAACASAPDRETVAALTAAQTSIDHAVDAGAADDSRHALHMAREKLEQARTAADHGDDAVAQRLADESGADATFAAADARAAAAKTSAEEIEKSLQALREEATRTTPR